MQNEKLAYFTFCLPEERIDKLGFIADYDKRSPSEEIEQMLLEWIRAFEEAEGTILLPERGTIER